MPETLWQMESAPGFGWRCSRLSNGVRMWAPPQLRAGSPVFGAVCTHFVARHSLCRSDHKCSFHRIMFKKCIWDFCHILPTRPATVMTMPRAKFLNRKKEKLHPVQNAAMRPRRQKTSACLVSLFSHTCTDRIHFIRVKTSTCFCSILFNQTLFSVKLNGVFWGKKWGLSEKSPHVKRASSSSVCHSHTFSHVHVHTPTHLQLLLQHFLYTSFSEGTAAASDLIGNCQKSRNQRCR